MSYALSLPLNKSHVMEQLDRLLRVYKRPQHAPADAAEFATDYAQICGELTSEQFTGAVDGYLHGAAKWFPKPGELLALGKAIARGPGNTGSPQAQYDQWERDSWQDPVTNRWVPCPICAAVMAWTVVAISAKGEAIERLQILHNAAVHWKVGVGFSMSAAPGTGGGIYEHQVIDHRPKPPAAAEPGT
jgi:hypothetical protein